MIRINKLCKSFDGKLVIKDLNISFPKDEFIAICGPSGCGKSTLLNIVAGLERADAGEVIFTDNKAKLSMSFQDIRLLSDRTAAQNVNLVMGDKSSTLKESEQLLEELGIIDHDLYPDELSGGMKARVGIARALAVKADIYLFDEPFASLDEETAHLVFKVIKAHTKGKLCIAVMHDRSLAFELTDSVIDFADSPLCNYTTSK